MIELAADVHPAPATRFPPHRILTSLARRIAFVWAPVLGYEDALEAANNTVAPLAFPDDLPPIVILAAGVLEHRVRAFGLNIDQRTVDFLALQAGRVWIASGHEAARHHAAARKLPRPARTIVEALARATERAA